MNRPVVRLFLVGPDVGGGRSNRPFQPRPGAILYPRSPAPVPVPIRTPVVVPPQKDRVTGDGP